MASFVPGVAHRLRIGGFITAYRVVFRYDVRHARSASTRPSQAPAPRTGQETSLARAKRTDRAEARRRHRAEAAGTEDGAGGEPTTPTDSPTAAKSSTKSGAMSTPAGRMGMGAAFRQSFHPVDVRADLAALPWLATHTKALWIPILITVVGAAAVALVSSPGDITAIVYQYFVAPPAIGGVFIAGFLAPRASWLLGVIVGLVSAIANAVLVVFFPLAIFAIAPDATQTRDAVLAGFLLSPVFGALFASGAAWYRRFLQLSSPNRGQRAEAKKKANDGKSRTSARDPKATAKR